MVMPSSDALPNGFPDSVFCFVFCFVVCFVPNFEFQHEHANNRAWCDHSPCQSQQCFSSKLGPSSCYSKKHKQLKPTYSFGSSPSTHTRTSRHWTSTSIR